MTAPQPIRVIEVRITEYAPTTSADLHEPWRHAALPRGYDPLVDSPLAGQQVLRYVGEPAPRAKRRWFR